MCCEPTCVGAEETQSVDKKGDARRQEYLSWHSPRALIVVTNTKAHTVNTQTQHLATIMDSSPDSSVSGYTAPYTPPTQAAPEERDTQVLHTHFW